MCHFVRVLFNSVAGNIARDNAKNLKIEEYNELFGVTEEQSDASAVADMMAQAIKNQWYGGHHGSDEDEADY